MCALSMLIHNRLITLCQEYLHGKNSKSNMCITVFKRNSVHFAEPISIQSYHTTRQEEINYIKLH